MRIVIVGAANRPHELACTHWKGLKTALKRSEHEYIFVCCRSDPYYVDKIVSFNPDLVVYGLIDMIIKEKVREFLKEKLPRTKFVVWYGDYRDDRTEQRCFDLKDTVDNFFVSNDGQHEFIKKCFNMNPQFLPLAVDPIPEPVIDPAFREDFVFVGGKSNSGPFATRAHIISILEEHHGLKRIDEPDEAGRAQVYRDLSLIHI